MKHAHSYLIIIAIIGLMLLGFFLLSPRKAETPINSEIISPSVPGHQNSLSENVPDDWKTFENTELNYTFKYPELLGTNYISTVDWPPQVQITSESFTCTSAGKVIDRTGKTEEKVINGTPYCITEIAEGAAGSIYHQYAYGFEYQENMLYMTASLRFVQCVNYDEPEQSECKSEQNNFNVDQVIDQIARTIVIGQ